MYKNGRSFEAVELAGLQHAFDELVQQTDRDFLRGQS
jgi:hypothetical protein